MLSLGRIITLDDNKEYTVLDTVNYLNNYYCYLIELNNFDNTKIYQISDDRLIEVKDDSLVNELENVFLQSITM